MGTSKTQQAVIKEDLEKVDAGHDRELLAKAQALLEAIQTHAPHVPKAVGLDLEDIKGASLTAQRILAEGPNATGVKLKGAEIEGDITFTDVAARSGDETPLKKGVEATANESYTSGATILQEVSAGGSILIGNTIYTRSDLEELKDYLAHAVSAYERDISQTILRRPKPSHPYKFLDPFGLKDEPIFFGREAATEELYKKVLRNRLTVLHAKSGAGKTSLLNAGLSPRIFREGCLPLYVHAYYQDEDPAVAIKRRIASPSACGPWPRLLHDLPLHDFLGLVCKRLSSDTREVVIVLDQFEQFFILWSRPEVRSPFIKTLGICCGDQDLRVRFIIALRKDYYSDLGEFERVTRHLHVFRNEYWLNPMTEKEVQAAIIRPLAIQDSSVSYDPALLETLLVDLARSGMELPLLQIICTRLYETRRMGDTHISLITYETLGRAEGVLGSYLKNELGKFPEREEVLARNVLKELVRSDATKQILSDKTLATRIETQRNKLDNVLHRLVDLRLLHRDETDGEVMYELAHEYLATEILKWVSSADQEFKQAEELLQRELVNWRILHMLIPRDRLGVLYPYRERFKDVDVNAWRCLISSALAEDFAAADWTKTAGASGELILLQALETKDAQIRQRAVETLGEIRCSRAVEPLIATFTHEDRNMRVQVAWALGEIGDLRAVEPLMDALKDEDQEVRERALMALAKIGDQAVEPLTAALNGKGQGQRRRALMALAKIGGSRAVEPLIEILKVKDPWMRRRAIEALGDIGDPRAVEPLSAFLNNDDHLIRRCAVEAWRKIVVREGERVSDLENTRKEGMGEV